jgi:hypothetical protein
LRGRCQCQRTAGEKPIYVTPKYGAAEIATLRARPLVDVEAARTSCSWNRRRGSTSAKKNR